MQYLTKHVKGSYKNSNTGSFAHDLKCWFQNPSVSMNFKKVKVNLLYNLHLNFIVNLIIFKVTRSS